MRIYCLSEPCMVHPSGRHVTENARATSGVVLYSSACQTPCQCQHRVSLLRASGKQVCLAGGHPGR